jgi:hypothetical protein
MNVNQCHFQVEKDLAGDLIFVPSKFVGSNTNPLMVSASHVTLPSAAGGSATATDLTAVEWAGGSQNLPCDAKYDFTCSIGSNHYTNIGAEHNMKAIRLYVPAYTMNPIYEVQYTAMLQKKITYTDVISYPKLNIHDEFNIVISNGQARLKRLICVPTISGLANGTAEVIRAPPGTYTPGNYFSPWISPFTTEPSTTSPYCIENFNCQLGGLNIYQNNKSYNFEVYLDEMHGNLTTDRGSSRISLNDYCNNYGYLVCDLSRRSEEDDTTPISLQVSGKVTSLLPLDLHFYVEYERSIVIDLLTGQMIN